MLKFILVMKLAEIAKNKNRLKNPPTWEEGLKDMMYML